MPDSFLDLLNSKLKQDTQPAPGLTEQQESIDAVAGNKGLSFTERVRERYRLQEQGVHVPHPNDTETAKRREGLRQGIEQQGIAAGPLGEPGLDDYSARFDLGLSDTFAEKRAKFIDRFPDGDFVEVPEPALKPGQKPSGRTILFRKNQEEGFAELDASMLEKFELLGDLSDISGDVPAAVMEAIVTRGGSLVKQILQIGAGQIAGDSLKEVLEELRGYQKETFAQQAERIGTRTGIAMTGGAATAPISGGVNMARGSASVKLLPGATEAQKAASALYLPQFLPTQIASSPILQRISAQAASTSSKIGDYMRDQQRQLVEAVSRLRDESALKLVAGPDAIASLHDDAVKEITSVIKSAKTSLTSGGEQIQAGIRDYDVTSAAAVSRAYAYARELGTPEFDVAPALAVARDLRAGVIARGKDGKPVQLQELPSDIVDEIDKLEALDPSLPPMQLPDGTVVTATDQLRALRQNLWNLKQVVPGKSTPEERRTAAQASKLYSAIDKVLKTPKNADPEFVTAWAKANAEASKRFSTLEKIFVVEASRSETPAQLAARLAKPLQVDNLKLIKEVVEPAHFEVFQRAVVSDLISSRNIDNLGQRLRAFDQETIDLLLPKAEQKLLGTVAENIDTLNQAGIKSAIRQQGETAAIIRDLTQRGDQAGLLEFVKRVETLPPDDQRRRIVRAGVIEDLFHSVVGRTKNGMAVDGKAMAAEIKRLNETGVARLLTAEDRQTIGHFDKLVDFLKSSSDTGTSLQAAEAVASARSGNIDAIKTIVHNVTIGRFVTSKWGQRILLGSGEKPWTMPTLRVLGAVLAQEAADVKSAADAGDLPPAR